MPAHDLPLLIEAARQAGEVATRFSGRTANRWDKPGGQGPVTEADLAVNDRLHDVLQSARPDYGWLSEETEDSDVRLGKEKVFIVDPIDGTRSFVDGSNTWAHSIAVAEQGVVTAAVVYLPLRDKLYSASLGGGAFLNDRAIAASSASSVAAATVLAARPVLKSENWADASAPNFKLGYRPSLAYRLALVAEGRFEAMLTLRHTWEWDIAAGTLIAAEAGGATFDRQGSALRFNNPDPWLNGVVAGSKPICSALVDALA